MASLHELNYHLTNSCSLSLSVYVNPKVGCQSSVDKARRPQNIFTAAPSPVDFQDAPIEKSVELKVPQNGECGGFTMCYGILSHKGYYPDDPTKPNQVI